MGPLIDRNSIHSIGIDDFKFKKHNYGTIIIDLETKKIIEIWFSCKFGDFYISLLELDIDYLFIQIFPDGSVFLF